MRDLLYAVAVKYFGEGPTYVTLSCQGNLPSHWNTSNYISSTSISSYILVSYDHQIKIPSPNIQPHFQPPNQQSPRTSEQVYSSS